jgi:GNAT superfamily N-acetyltransferase
MNTDKNTEPAGFSIRPAQPSDVAAILGMIVELAVFEKLEHLVVATEAGLHEGLFGPRPSCEALIGTENGVPVTFALFFHNFSTFLCRKGLYLEDLYVKQDARGKGYGKKMLIALAQLARERDCGRFEWSVLDWNERAISFYKSVGADVMPDWRICRVAGDALEKLSAAGPRKKNPRGLRFVGQPIVSGRGDESTRPIYRPKTTSMLDFTIDYQR